MFTWTMRSRELKVAINVSTECVEVSSISTTSCFAPMTPATALTAANRSLSASSAKATAVGQLLKLSSAG